MVSSLRVLTALSALAASGLLPRADDTPVARPPEPSDDPAPPRYVGIDHRLDPGPGREFQRRRSASHLGGAGEARTQGRKARRQRLDEGARRMIWIVGIVAFVAGFAARDQMWRIWP